MVIKEACTHILNQLEYLVTQINEKDFVEPSDSLNCSTIGQHLRHTLEFFICLEKGIECGVVNYDKRAHDKHLETDKFIALSSIQRIKCFIELISENAPLILEVTYDTQSKIKEDIHTNVTRELVYNIEHAIHHMAIVKIGVREIAPYISLPADFGVATSTIRHKQGMETSSHR